VGRSKTTIAINLASYYALNGEQPALLDFDPQAPPPVGRASARSPQAPFHLITAFEKTAGDQGIPVAHSGSHARVIIDTPAAIGPTEMPALTANADKILVPVLPSDIDIQACVRSIASLLLVAKVRRTDNRLGIIANRVRRNTLMYQSLTRFLTTLDIPIIATLRDSQNYVRGAELGLGIHEMHYQVSEDLRGWADARLAQ
jgi:chromosome partitioning protein